MLRADYENWFIANRRIRGYRNRWLHPNIYFLFFILVWQCYIYLLLQKLKISGSYSKTGIFVIQFFICVYSFTVAEYNLITNHKNKFYKKP
jgi:hypothetical protein